ncbi:MULTISPECIES: LacI family DNA-binding transcriptional regulator [Bacillaceae]|uniref:LacI family transcriptional regulator n=1 Tax=Evansella alkalicola TaxID=745819 RepID=A0ABS6K0T1_9BACI|nr:MULTISPECIES: LacI family DNA-binding transcriptional regulator [Bacillaceae]MBU9722970.1 LacI family transcriptional regulator [Bacillus alkalicola]
MTTIYDIAKKTGFSISTVSKVLNNYTDVGDKTRKIINDAVKEMGYYPSSSARTLSTKKSWTIGVVNVEKLGLEHPFFSGVIESFMKKVEAAGYDLLFVSDKIGNKSQTYLDHFRYRGVDGVIIVCISKDDPYMDMLIESEIPTVLIDIESRKASVVSSDNHYGSELAVNYLASLGHKKIAHISAEERLLAGAHRLEGFMQAMKKNDLHIQDGYIVSGGVFTIEGGKEAMERLLDLSEPPTAVFAAGDLMALGALMAIRERGLDVPNDISLIGFDDLQMIQYTTPALTSIKQDTALIGRTAATILLEQMNNEDEPQQHVSVKVPVSLVERDSCKKLTPVKN